MNAGIVRDGVFRNEYRYEQGLGRDADLKTPRDEVSLIMSRRERCRGKDGGRTVENEKRHVVSSMSSGPTETAAGFQALHNHHVSFPMVPPKRIC